MREVWERVCTFTHFVIYFSLFVFSIPNKNLLKTIKLFGLSLVSVGQYNVVVDKHRIRQIKNAF